MAHIQSLIHAMLDPQDPVKEICIVISAVTAHHPGREADILQGVVNAAQARIEQLKGAEQTHAQSIRESDAAGEDQG